MLRKTMIALFAAASVAMLAPDTALARGGFGGGGFRGGGGFHGGGFHGGGFRGGAIGQAAEGFAPRRSAAVSAQRRFPRQPDSAAAILPVIAAAPSASGIADFRLPPPHLSAPASVTGSMDRTAITTAMTTVTRITPTTATITAMAAATSFSSKS